jgi:hypothetical protein
MSTKTELLYIPSALIAALIEVESGGNDRAVGDGGLAVGCLQIHEITVRDVNRILRHPKGEGFSPEARFSRQHAVDMCRTYLAHYANAARIGREPTLEDMARIWNGGPDGWKKPATAKYWAKVKRALMPGELLPEVVAGLQVNAAPTPQKVTDSVTAEERQAWDRYASAALGTTDVSWGTNKTIAIVAEYADALIAERRKRFPIGGAA